jgi:hypothetical protein
MLTHVQRRSIRAVAMAAIVAAALTVPGTASASVSIRTVGGGSDDQAAPRRTGSLVCTRYTPAFPLEMNTIAVRGLFKTVVMEKDLYTCNPPTSAKGKKNKPRPAGGFGPFQEFRDVETFIEVVQRGQSFLEISVYISTCAHSFSSGVHCGWSSKIRIPSSPLSHPLEGCDSSSLWVPNDPVEMTTTQSAGYVKTIKIDKFIYTCGSRYRHFYLFTELVERIANVPGPTDSYRPYPWGQRSFGVYCETGVTDAAAVDPCYRFETAEN